MSPAKADALLPVSEPVVSYVIESKGKEHTRWHEWACLTHEGNARERLRQLRASLLPMYVEREWRLIRRVTVDEVIAS